MQETKKLIFNMINQAQLSHDYGRARIEPPYHDDPQLAVAQAALDATVDTAGKILQSIKNEENDALEEIKEFIEAQLKEIRSDERYSYEPANVFINAPLALIQTNMKAQVRAYEIMLAEVKEKIK